MLQDDEKWEHRMAAVGQAASLGQKGRSLKATPKDSHKLCWATSLRRAWNHHGNIHGWRPFLFKWSAKDSADYIQIHVCIATLRGQNPTALKHKHIVAMYLSGNYFGFGAAAAVWVEGPNYSKHFQIMNSLVLDLCLISFSWNIEVAFFLNMFFFLQRGLFTRGIIFWS